MKYSAKYTSQLLTGLFILSIAGVLINNLWINLIRTNMGLSFGWLIQPAGFELAEKSIPYAPHNSYSLALLVGWLNSLKVITISLLITTIIGVGAGLARISKNYLLRTISRIYVALIRQIPLLLQLFFWYFVVFLGLSNSPIENHQFINVSNQGIQFLGLKLTVEFSSLIIGLSVFTGASIAEIVRGGITSVSYEQWEAFRSLGIPELIGLRRIIIPQSLPAILPALTSQYLNLAKNSTLAIAVGYTDLYAVSDTTITQTGRAVEGFLILLSSFLILNLLITFIMNIINKITLSPYTN